MKRTSITSDPFAYCLCLATLTLALSCASGCGNSGNAVVTGKVRHQGKTLASGTVVLFGENNQPIQGPIAPDGTFHIQGAPHGPARIAVFSPGPGKAVAQRKLPPEIKERLKDKVKTPPALDMSKWFPIPDIYNNPETSGLRLRIDKSETKFDIDLP